jgi:hypothetical protein
MTSLTMSAIVFGCIFGGTLLGFALRGVLPDNHLNGETKDVVKLGMGLIGTMSALVLGLLVAGAKSSFDAQGNGVALLAGKVMYLDRLLARYGPEAKGVRQTLHDSIEDMLHRTWPETGSAGGRGKASESTEGQYEGIFDQLQALSPTTEAQKSLKAGALKVMSDMAEARWALLAQRGNGISVPFLVVLACWMAIVFASFSLFAPSNVTVFATFVLCALVVASTIFIILEMDHPFDGLLRVSSEPLQKALAQLGR